jgi:rubrerythrin
MRAGSTRTTSFSLDDATRRNLKALAERRHGGNVSALLAELATREVKLAAAEAFFERYGVPPLSDEAVSRIEAEWRGEPDIAAERRQPPSKRKRRPDR